MNLSKHGVGISGDIPQGWISIPKKSGRITGMMGDSRQKIN